MKSLVVIWLALAVVVIFCSYEVGFSKGGGWEDQSCNADALPEPTNGTFLTGTFTVALDKSSCSIDYPWMCAHYSIHAVLEPTNSNKFRLFSFPVQAGINLCDPTVTDEKLLEEFLSVPCLLKVGQVFGIPGTPVLTNISVKTRDCGEFCNPNSPDTCPEEMIRGTLKIRMVPQPK